MADVMINDGGPAFPTYESNGDGHLYCSGAGMSLRDHFAGCELSKTTGTYLLDESIAYERLAQHCYRMADAMIAARQAAGGAQ